MIKQAQHFERVALPHLNAAYNLARWLVRDEHIAQDMVQEAYMRALKYFSGFHGDDFRPWILSIVRNTCYTWLQANKSGEGTLEFDENLDSETYALAVGNTNNNPEALLLGKQERSRVNLAIGSLPPVFREVLVLRELEDMSYDEIATVAGIPAGTVMSRLARARTMLRALLNKEDQS